MPRSDALSNPGTSKVFLYLVKGITNPKAIADELEIKPPPVIQQLRRLQNLGLVELGKKDGRAQNYKILWKNFVDRFAKEASKIRISPGDIRISAGINYGQIDMEIESLKTNRFFHRFVRLYLQNFVSMDESKWPTIAEIIDNTNAVMTMLTNFQKKRQFDDPDKQEFFDKMRTWYERNTRFPTWIRDNMDKAITDTLNS